MNNNVFGINARHYRIAQGRTQADVAREAGITRPHLVGIERGRYNPSIITADAIARALNVKIADLMGEAES